MTPHCIKTTKNDLNNEKMTLKHKKMHLKLKKSKNAKKK